MGSSNSAANATSTNNTTSSTSATVASSCAGSGSQAQAVSASFTTAASSAAPARAAGSQHQPHTSAGTIALTALFTAASFVLSFIQIPIFPAAPWLMYDPSGIVCLIAALAFGPKMGAAVAIISWLPRVFIDPFGAPMGMLSTCAFVVPAALIYRSGRRTRASSVAGMLVGAALSITASVLMNLVVTPLYTAVSVADVVAMIVPILIPFNALKMAINVTAGQVLLAPCMNVLDGGVEGASSKKHEHHVSPEVAQAAEARARTLLQADEQAERAEYSAARRARTTRTAHSEAGAPAATSKPQAAGAVETS